MDIDEAEIWMVAAEDDGALHGHDLVAANVLASQGKMERQKPADPRANAVHGSAIEQALAASRKARADADA